MRAVKVQERAMCVEGRRVRCPYSTQGRQGARRDSVKVQAHHPCPTPGWASGTRRHDEMQTDAVLQLGHSPATSHDERHEENGKRIEHRDPKRTEQRSYGQKRDLRGRRGARDNLRTPKAGHEVRRCDDRRRKHAKVNPRAPHEGHGHPQADGNGICGILACSELTQQEAHACRHERIDQKAQDRERHESRRLQQALPCKEDDAQKRGKRPREEADRQTCGIEPQVAPAGDGRDQDLRRNASGASTSRTGRRAL